MVDFCRPGHKKYLVQNLFILCNIILIYKPVAVPSVKVIGTLISLLLTIPPDIITVAIITLDDSDPLNVDDPNVIIATVQ